MTEPVIIASHHCRDWSLEKDSDERIFMRIGEGGPRTIISPEDADSISSWLACHTKGHMNAYIELGNAIAAETQNGMKQTAAKVKLFPGLYAWRPGEEWPCVPCYDPMSPWAHTCHEKKGQLTDMYSQDDKKRQVSA